MIFEISPGVGKWRRREFKVDEADIHLDNVFPSAAVDEA